MLLKALSTDLSCSDPSLIARSRPTGFEHLDPLPGQPGPSPGQHCSARSPRGAGWYSQGRYCSLYNAENINVGKKNGPC